MWGQLLRQLNTQWCIIEWDLNVLIIWERAVRQRYLLKRTSALSVQASPCFYLFMCWLQLIGGGHEQQKDSKLVLFFSDWTKWAIVTSRGFPEHIGAPHSICMKSMFSIVLHFPIWPHQKTEQPSALDHMRPGKRPWHAYMRQLLEPYIPSPNRNPEVSKYYGLVLWQPLLTARFCTLLRLYPLGLIMSRSRSQCKFPIKSPFCLSNQLCTVAYVE